MTNNVISEHVAASDWTEKAEFLRSVSGVSASWDAATGSLTSLTLGPESAKPGQPVTQPQKLTEEQIRMRKHDVVLSASSRLVRVPREQNR